MSGPVEGDAALTGDRTVGAVAWAWLTEGQVDGMVAEVPFEPLVYRYALDILPPPDPDQGTSPTPSTLGTDGLALLVGWPILAEPDGDAEIALSVDAEGLVDWVAGDRPDPDGLVTVVGGRLAAGTTEHVLVLLAADDPGVGRLATAPTWEPGTDLCRLDGVVTGLTLYRSAGLGCFGWEPLAPAGTRTEFQGIPMGPVSP